MTAPVTALTDWRSANTVKREAKFKRKENCASVTAGLTTVVEVVPVSVPVWEMVPVPVKVPVPVEVEAEFVSEYGSVVVTEVTGATPGEVDDVTIGTAVVEDGVAVDVVVEPEAVVAPDSDVVEE